MAADAVTVITRDHRVIEDILDRLRSGQGDRVALLNEVGVRLEAHSRAEEDHVYPAVIRDTPAEETEVYHGYEEHHEAIALLYALKQIEPTDPAFDRTLREFVEAVLAHVREEEAQILPALAASVSPERLRDLGLEFEHRRRRELAAHGLREEDMSTEELSAEARAAGIPDSAMMSRNELIRALRESGR